MPKQKQALQTTDTAIYSYWQAIWMSFYSSALYKDVAKHWKGFGIQYLLFVILLSSLPFSCRLIMDFNNYIEYQLVQPLQQLPALYIQNGKITINEYIPYQIRNDKGQLLALIDNREAIEPLEIFKKNPYLYLLISKNIVYHREPNPKFFFDKSEPRLNTEIEGQTIPLEDNEIFNAKEWIQNSNFFKFKIVILLLMYPSVVLSVFFVYSWFLFIFSMLGQLLVRMLFVLKLSFKESARLLAVAATPQTLIFFLLITLDMRFKSLGPICLCLTAIYYFYAANQVRRDRVQLVKT